MHSFSNNTQRILRTTNPPFSIKFTRLFSEVGNKVGMKGFVVSKYAVRTTTALAVEMWRIISKKILFCVSLLIKENKIIMNTNVTSRHTMT